MYILNRGLVRVLVLVSVVLSQNVWAQQVELRSPPQEKKQNSLLDSTVRIRAVDPATLVASTGAGVAVSNGLILTAAHVVGKNKEVEILVGNGDDGASYDGHVEVCDPFLDLCLIRMVNAFEKKVTLPPIVISADFPVQTGTRVYAVGNPLGFTLTVSEGIVSACGVQDGEKFLLTDALIKSGNSGGPLVNQKGELVGLVLSTIQTMESNVGLARSYGNVIPSITIQEFLSHPRAICEGYLGVLGKTVSTGYGNLAASQGLQIERVLRTESGLLVGDILMMVEDNPIASSRNLISVVRTKTPGSKLKAFVIRNGSFTEVSLLVAARPK